MTDQYIWLFWATAFLLPWAALYVAFPRYRSVMWHASWATSLFGLTEPLFVPEYWNPPTLFGLAQRTGFDLESLIFCFGIGGVGAVLYNVVSARDLVPIPRNERAQRLHRHHYLALSTPVVVFLALYFLPWNPIYPSIVALAAGALAAALCRRDLAAKSLVGGLLFLGYYAAFVFGLEWAAPGYVERVWNLAALSGVSLLGIPIEELLFGFTFGLYWSGVYEHLTWTRAASLGRASRQAPAAQAPAFTKGLR